MLDRKLNITTQVDLNNMIDLSPAGFASYYFGRRVYVESRYSPIPGLEKKYPDDQPFAKIIGYNTKKHYDNLDIIVEFESPLQREKCWQYTSANDEVVILSNYTGLDKVLKCFMVPKRCLTFIVDKKIKPSKPIKIYPDTCLTCKSPAKFSNNLIMCSNGSCKTRQVIKKIIGVKYRKTSVIRCINVHRTKKCNGRAVFVRSSREKQVFDCENGHRFISEPKDNDVVLCNIALRGSCDLIWIGGKWEKF